MPRMPSTRRRCNELTIGLSVIPASSAPTRPLLLLAVQPAPWVNRKNSLRAIRDNRRVFPMHEFGRLPDFSFFPRGQPSTERSAGDVASREI